MAIDLRNDKGELDRSKVITEIRRIVWRIHGENESSSALMAEDAITVLMDAVAQAAWQDGHIAEVNA